MSEESSSSIGWPVRILVYFLATIGLVWFLATNLTQYILLEGGIRGYITVGALLTLMNLLVRPLIRIFFAPFHFIFGVIATIGMNWLFLYLTMRIAEHFDPTVVVFDIEGGFVGYLFIAVILGIANWIFRLLKL
jgi:uncharacterized membrane protein YvlD (DUF360 family)